MTVTHEVKVTTTARSKAQQVIDKMAQFQERDYDQYADLLLSHKGGRYFRTLSAAMDEAIQKEDDQ